LDVILKPFDRRRRRVVWLAVLGVWAGMPLLLPIYQAVMPTAPPWIIAVAIAWGMLFIQQVGQWLIRRIDQEQQEKLLELGQEIRRGKAAPFALYLRPFWSDAALKQSHTHLNDPIDPSSISNPSGEVHIESLLMKLCIRKGMPLIKLGALTNESPERGAASLDTGDAWFEEVIRLASRANFIFLVPSATQGTLQEIAWLKDSGHLERTVVIIPPQYMLKSVKAQWEAVAPELQNLQLEIPSESVFTGMFRWKIDGGIDKKTTVVSWGRTWTSFAIGQVLQDISWFSPPLWLKLLAAPPAIVALFIWHWLSSTYLTTCNWWRGINYLPFAVRLLLLPFNLIFITTVCSILTIRDLFRAPRSR